MSTSPSKHPTYASHIRASHTTGLSKVFKPRLAALAVALSLGTAAGVLATTSSVALSEARPATALLPTGAAINPAAGFADLIEQVRPAVVNVTVAPGKQSAGVSHGGLSRIPEGMPEAFRELFDRHFGQSHPSLPMPSHPHQGNSVGSGFVIDSDGWIVTNHHVVTGSGEVTVTLQDGSKLTAKRAGADPKTDLALLKVETDKPLTSLKFGDSGETRVGDWVLAVGNPFGLGGSVSAGIVSARGRDIGSGPFDDFIQVDAPINRGNSGGPLFNTRGEVIGINTAIVSPSGGNVGIGFAIPSKLALPLIESLRESGQVERGWLGVRIQNLNEELAAGMSLRDKSGALVAGVLPDTPAAKAGLKAGDVIVSFDGTPIEKARDLTRNVAAAKAGSAQKLGVVRNGKTLELRAELGRYPTSSTARQALEPAEKGPRLGLSVAPMRSEQSGTKGLRIATIDPTGAAARHGVRPGDIIMRADGEAVGSVDDLRNSVAAAAKADKPLVLWLKRDDGSLFLAIDLESADS